jgi:hypothetical protein
MKHYVRLFIRSGLYFLMEIMFLVVASLLKPHDEAGDSVFMYMALLGAVISAWGAYRQLTKAIIARQLALQY